MTKLMTPKPKEVRSVRFSPEELALVAAAAKKFGVSVSEWIRQAAVKWHPTKKDLE